MEDQLGTSRAHDTSHLPRAFVRRLAVLWAASALLGAVVVRARAEVGEHEVITMDHHLVSSDFGGLVYVESVEAVNGGSPETSFHDLRLRVLETWFSRWPAQAGTVLEFGTTGTEPPTADTTMVVFLQGGPYDRSPYTFGTRSRFTLRDDGTIACGDGTTLFGVWTDAFICTVQLHVIGAPMPLDAFHSRVTEARSRAVSRLSRVAAARDEARTPLSRYPAHIRGAP